MAEKPSIYAMHAGARGVRGKRWPVPGLSAPVGHIPEQALLMGITY